MGSPSPDRHVPKPVLYRAPNWVQDCGVDELLNQFGYTTETDTDRPNQPGCSSLDNQELDIDEHIELQTEAEASQPAEATEETEQTPAYKQTPLGNRAYPNGWPSGFYFGDGSVGKYSKYPPITRCGEVSTMSTQTNSRYLMHRCLSLAKCNQITELKYMPSW